MLCMGVYSAFASLLVLAPVADHLDFLFFSFLFFSFLHHGIFLRVIVGGSNAGRKNDSHLGVG